MQSQRSAMEPLLQFVEDTKMHLYQFVLNWFNWRKKFLWIISISEFRDKNEDLKGFEREHFSMNYVRHGQKIIMLHTNWFKIQHKSETVEK